MKRVCVVITARASYARVYSALVAIKAHPALELQIVLHSSALLDRYGAVEPMLTADGFSVDARVRSIVEGGDSLSMVKSTAVALMELPSVFERLQPDCVVTIADRFETLATAMAARYLNIPLVHLQGGEVTGNIDDEVRRAITQMAVLHCVATKNAVRSVLEQRHNQTGNVLVQSGCPSIDLALESAKLPDPRPSLFDNFGGIGPRLDLSGDFLMVLQHPVTNEQSETRQQIQATLDAVLASGLPALWFWPNVDAGTDIVAKTLREFHESHQDAPIHFFRHLPPRVFLRLMACPSVIMVGNSSAAIREGSALGTKGIDIGHRQQGRETSGIHRCQHETDTISLLIRKLRRQNGHVRSPLYGDGHAGQRIAEAIANAI